MLVEFDLVRFPLTLLSHPPCMFDVRIQSARKCGEPFRVLGGQSLGLTGIANQILEFPAIGGRVKDRLGTLNAVRVQFLLSELGLAEGIARRCAHRLGSGAVLQ